MCLFVSPHRLLCCSGSLQSLVPVEPPFQKASTTSPPSDGTHRLGSSALLCLCLSRLPTIVTSNRGRVRMGFRFLVIPLLIRCLPDFLLAAIATPKRLVDVKLRQPTVGVNVVQFRRVSGQCGWVLTLNFFGQRRNALGFRQLFGRRIATRVSLNRHTIAA